MLWNTLVVLLTVGVSLVAVREGLRLRLLQEADSELFDDAQANRLTVVELFPHWETIQREIDRQASAHTHRHLFVQLLDEQGKVQLASRGAPELGAFIMAPTQRDIVRTIQGYRLASRSVELPDGRRLTVRVGASLDPVHADVLRISQIMLSVGLLLLVLAPFSGFWLARRATEPVAQIIDTARRLRPDWLTERLPTRGTGDELDRIALTVNGLLDRIGAYLQQNREFVANAAHEMRSPLAAIQNAVEVALNSDRSTEEYKELLNSLVEECSALTGLVNQLLTLAEVESEPRSNLLRPVMLDQLAAKAVAMFQGIADERDIDLRASLLCRDPVAGDTYRLRQVINNLVDNALKFTPAGGWVLVELVDSPQDPSQILLRVQDSGAGIPPEDLPHVFDRFYRGDKSRHREGPTAGTGLGLSICSAIVRAHGGEITVHSSQGQGACFEVTLRRANLLAPAAVLE